MAMNWWTFSGATEEQIKDRVAVSADNPARIEGYAKMGRGAIKFVADQKALCAEPDCPIDSDQLDQENICLELEAACLLKEALKIQKGLGGGE